MPKLRVLITADAVGGVWTYALDLARGLAARRVETVLAVLGPAPDMAQRADAQEVPGLSLVETGLPLDWTAAGPDELRHAGARLSALATETGVHLVHLNTPALAAVASLPVPVVVTSHSCLATWWTAVKGSEPLPEDFAWRHDLAARGLRAADAVTAPTRAFAEETQRAHGLSVLPRVVANGRTAPVRDPARRSDAPRHFALTAGRLWDEGKNVATLDRAASRMLAPIFAAGPLEGPAGASIALSHARPMGRLCEPVLQRWLEDAPVFVSVALYEPFGLTVLEAAQAGCALVLSDIPSFRELWDGVALFVPAMNEDAIAETVETLVWDEMRCAALGERARNRAARFTVDAMASGMLGVYRGVLRSTDREEVAA
jgi:glycosyltransferase involved in cell wall biosynthesis